MRRQCQMCGNSVISLKFAESADLCAFWQHSIRISHPGITIIMGERVNCDLLSYLAVPILEQRMQQLILGVIVALVVLAMFGLPVISDQAPPPHAGTIIIGAG